MWWVTGEEYDRITDYQLGPIPESAAHSTPEEYDPLDFPFGYNVAAPTEEEILW